MQMFVCGKNVEKYILASRFSNVGAIISEKRYNKLLEFSKKDSDVDIWTIGLLEKLGLKASVRQKINDLIIVRRPTNYSFSKASYEITEDCNYRCSHCYLGKKNQSTLSMSEKKQIIELIESSGCLWLQITGGEPLLDRDFIEVYKYAHSLGFLITISTNGSLLTEERISHTIKRYPPYRLTISAYGATANSYESLTRIPGSFKSFVEGLDWVGKTDIRTRLNIITTKYNQDEINDIKELAEKYSFECYNFTSLLPTIYGDSAPLELMSQDRASINKRSRIITSENCYTPCNAGKTAFHVNSTGKISICKTARKPNIDLLKLGQESFREISIIKEKISDSSDLCKSCDLRMKCTTCPLILNQYLVSKKIPAFICRKHCTD